MVEVKKILFIFLLVIFLFQANSVFALEIKYPPLPGAETPNQIQEKVSRGIISEQDSLPLYINYFLRLIFLITISIAIIVIIYGGVLYLISGAKPAVLVTAKTRISQGLLGLLILICSYLILAVINPQLLVFKIKPSLIFPSPPTAVSIPLEKVIVQQVPLGYLLEEALEDMGEEVTVTSSPAITLHRIEVPLHRAEKTLEKLSLIIWDKDKPDNSLIGLLSKCKCGESKFHEEVEWSLSKGGKCKCVGGVKKEDREGERNEDIDEKIAGFTETASSTEAMEAAGETRKSLSMKVAGLDRQQRCLMNCRDCGTKNCDLETIKTRRDELIEGLAHLQVLGPQFSAEGIDLIKTTLYQGAANFLAQHTIGPTFQEDFVYQKKSYEEMGKEVEILPFKGIENIPLTELSPAITDPFTINIITYGSGNPVIDRENQKRVDESDYVNFIYLLAMREEIQAAIQDCLTKAFGNVKTEGVFSIEKFEEIITRAIQEGLGGSLNKYFEGQNAKIASSMIETMNKEVEKDVEEKATTTCATTKCKGFTPKTPEYKSCMGKCLKPPPHFLSDLTAKLLTEKVEERLPRSVRETLNKSVEDVIFDPEFQKYYKEKFITKLDKLLGGALTKTLTEQFPALKQWLDKRLVSYLPEFIQSSLNKLDFWIAGKLKYVKKGIYKDVEKYTAELIRALSNPLVGAVENYRKGRFTAAKYDDDPEGCRDAGYIYQEGKCTEPMPIPFEEITERCKEPSEINNEPECIGKNYYWYDNACHSAEEGKEDPNKKLCEDQGYCWEWGECKEKCEWIQAEAPNLSWEDVAAGAINLLQEFIVALTDVATYTLTKYALVWVEDTILRPLQPYISQISDFQEKLHNFLQTTIKEALPQQIATYLQSSIVSIVDDICRNQNQTTTITHYSGYTEIGPGDKEVLCNINEKLHENIKDQFSSSTRDLLDSKVKSFLPDDIKEVLDKTPAELFFPQIKNIEKLILGTPKQFICGDLVPTKNGVVDWGGTLLHTQCENMKAKFANITVPVIDSNNSEFQKNRELYGSICPVIWMYCDAPAKLLDFNIGKFIATVIKKECEGIDDTTCNILVKDSLAQTFFYQLIYTTHGSIEERDKDEEKIDFQWLIALFDGKTKPLLRDDIEKVAKKREFSNEEWNQLYKEVEAYTDFGELPENIRKGAMLVTSWFTEDKTLFEILTSPNLGVMRYFHPKEKEGKEYVYGPGKNFLARTPYDFLHDDVCGRIIWKFETDYTDWSFNKVYTRISAEIRRRVSEAPPYTVERLERVTYAKVFNAIRKTGQVPLERKYPYLFCLSLDKNPAQILDLDQELMYYVYPKEYQIMFALMKKELKPDEMPEMLNKLIDALYKMKPVDVLRKETGVKLINKGNLQMGHCASKEEKINCCENEQPKDASLEQICSQWKEGYITPEQDIKDMCNSISELNEKQTPFALCVAGTDLEAKGTYIKELADFLDTTIGKQIQDSQPYYWKTKIIELIFDKLEEDYGIKCEIAGKESGRNCLNKNLWQLLEKEEWQKMRDQIFAILNETPVKLIETYLNKNLLQLLSPEIQTALSTPIIDYIAADLPILNERYVDTFGDWFGLTDNVYNTYLGVKKVEAVVDKTIYRGQAMIQGSFDKYFMEYPEAGIKWIGNSIAGIFGAIFGEKTADSMVGIGCKDASQKEKDNEECLKEEWVFKPAHCCHSDEGCRAATSKEIKDKECPEEWVLKPAQCCNLGQGLVCEPKLTCKIENEKTELAKWRRIEPEEDETCRNWETKIEKPVDVNIGTGEEPEWVTVTTTYCCVNKCKRYRELEAKKCREYEKCLNAQGGTYPECVDSKYYNETNCENVKVGTALFCCQGLEEKDGNCCFSLMDCIAEKLTPILEQIAGLYTGNIPVNDLEDILIY